MLPIQIHSHYQASKSSEHCIKPLDLAGLRCCDMHRGHYSLTPMWAALRNPASRHVCILLLTQALTVKGSAGSSCKRAAGHQAKQEHDLLTAFTLLALCLGAGERPGSTGTPGAGLRL